MTLADRVSALSSSLLEKIRSRATLPEQLAALQAADSALGEPANSLTDARARITQLEGELAAANTKLADMEARVNALVEARVGSVIAENKQLKSEAQTAEQRAIEIMARVGQPAPVNSDTKKGAIQNVEQEAGQSGAGLAGVEAMYRKKYGN